ncbi:phosphate ABC transporter substrate-binding protein [bacterium]|nr:MAG: phosphate ABC transporter substrate-binding protein [bacterium]
MNRETKFFLASAAACLLLATAAGCGGNKSGDAAGKAAGARTVIQNKGSDTMVNIAQAWAEAYKKAEPAVEIEVSGGGSGVGIAALSKGAVDIANSSRNMKAKEVEDAKKNTGKEPREFIVGYDALAIFVHKDNPLNEISMEQIARIYEEGGDITKWSDLGVKLPGGQDEIVRVSRQSSSGTYEFLREHVLKNKDFRLGSRDLNGSKEVVELVANTAGAIGYSGMGYATPGVKMLRVSEKAGAPGVAPTLESAKNKTYPISRSLQMYTLGEPQGAVKKYIDWILSDAGQAIVEQSGYVSIPANMRTK